MTSDLESAPVLPEAFDFSFAVRSPFRMQPGLRRLSPTAAVLTPLRAGSRAQREKLAVLSAFPGEALLTTQGFDPMPALDALMRHATSTSPDALTWDGHRVEALHLGVAVDDQGRIHPTRSGDFGLGKELPTCLEGLAPEWRLAGLLSLIFAEDLAIVDGSSGSLNWMAVCLPSFWSPAEKIGRRFAEVHAPVADNGLLLTAAESLMRLVSGPDRWERFVWNVTPHPRLHGHPSRLDPRGWDLTPVASAWWRTERQAFLPVAGSIGAQAVFTIRVEVTPLVQALRTAEQAQALRDALASQSAAVQAYRHLDGVALPLMDWLEEQAARLPRESDGPPSSGSEAHELARRQQPS